MSNVSIQKGGNPAPALATVACDQKTIRGSGTSDDPLHAGSGAGATFEGHVDDFHAFALAGSVWSVSSADQMARLDPDGGAQFGGMLTKTIAHPSAGHDTGVFQMSGPVVLTTAEWDAITDNPAGGLQPGQLYNASITTPGNISDAIIGAGHVRIRIGVALNTTTLLLGPAPGVGT